MINLGSILKSRDIILPTKVHNDSGVTESLILWPQGTKSYFISHFFRYFINNETDLSRALFKYVCVSIFF